MIEIERTAALRPDPAVTASWLSGILKGRPGAPADVVFLVMFPGARRAFLAGPAIRLDDGKETP